MDDSLHELSAAYALDALDADERERFEWHLASCERCRDELEEFWSVAGALAYGSGGPPPPPTLRERVLSEARRELPTADVVPLRTRLALPAAASFAAVAAVLAVGLGLWGTSLNGQVDELRSELAGTTEAVAILSDPASRQLSLSGADGRLVISRTGQAALVLTGVDRAPEGKTYEIWVIEDGTATPAGLFDGGETHSVVPVERAVPDDAVVAVTLEDDGGADVPTGSPLFATEPV